MNLLNYLKSKPKRLFGSLIKNTISRSDKSKDLENENVALFTNLGINSIDGSITFIKNTIKTLNHLDVHVHLIVIYEPEGQFLEFTQSQKLLSCHVVKHEKKDVCEKCSFKSKYSEVFNVFHIDGDLQNCRPNNLKTICANCQRTLQKEGVKWRQGDLRPDF